MTRSLHLTAAGVALLSAFFCGGFQNAWAEETWETPRTIHGDPDLQGLWTNATITALQRPGWTDQLVLSEAEATRWEAQNSAMFESIDDVPEEGLQSGGDVGGYNSFWMDPGTRVLRVRGEPRGSIITHPEDGQIPFRMMK